MMSNLLSVLWMTSFLRYGSYRCMSIALQRVTSLRRRVQANAPAASLTASCPR